jgi:two-component system response regulator HydG
MRAAVELLDRVTASDATVLLQGESGTGKELAARWVHERGARALQPFVAVNCGALPETLLETELFGHEAGAFTGATARHEGRFERAHRGTLFLDEVGELSPSAQARLLRVLETKTIERVGGTEPVAVDARIVAATHRDLQAMVASGDFREDLYYRLAVFTVRLPALRERPEDVADLAERFVRELADEHGRSLRGLTPDAREKLVAHRWPGNIRELRNAIAHACLVAPGPEITAADLPPTVGERRSAPTASAEGGLTLPASLREVEEVAVRAALDAAEGNKAKASRILGINRATLYAKLELYGIET